MEEMKHERKSILLPSYIFTSHLDMYIVLLGILQRADIGITLNDEDRNIVKECIENYRKEPIKDDVRVMIQDNHHKLFCYKLLKDDDLRKVGLKKLCGYKPTDRSIHRRQYIDEPYIRERVGADEVVF